MIKEKVFETDKEAGEWLANEDNTIALQKKYPKDYQCDYNQETRTLEVWHITELSFKEDIPPSLNRAQRRAKDKAKKNN